MCPRFDSWRRPLGLSILFFGYTKGCDTSNDGQNLQVATSEHAVILDLLRLGDSPRLKDCIREWLGISSRIKLGMDLGSDLRKIAGEMSIKYLPALYILCCTTGFESLHLITHVSLSTPAPSQGQSSLQILLVWLDSLCRHPMVIFVLEGLLSTLHILDAEHGSCLLRVLSFPPRLSPGADCDRLQKRVRCCDRQAW